MRTLAGSAAGLLLAIVIIAEAGIIATGLAWLPSATYAVAAAADALLIDGLSSGSLRVDQLGSASAINSTDTIPTCQGCNSSTTLVAATITQIETKIAAMMTSAQQTWSAGQQLTPCTLTNSSNIAVNLSLANICTITLSANNQKIQNPTGVTSGNWETFSFVITQPSSGGPDNVAWDTAYYFNAGTPPQQSNGGLTAANNATDMVTCNINNSSGTYTALCGGPTGTNNLASSSKFVLRNNSVSASDLSGAGDTTLSVTIANSTAGDLRTVELFGCANACGSGPASSRATSVTDGFNACVGVTNAFYGGANGSSTDIWACPKITGSTSATITVTWPQAMQYVAVCVQEWVPSTVAPDAGIGNTTTGTGANPSYATAVSTTQPNQLVVSMLNDASATTANAGTQLCLIGGNTLAQYQTPASTGVVTNSATASAGRWSASVASFLHY